MNPVVSVPRVTLAIDDILASARETDSVAAISIQQRLSEPTVCEITFAAAHGEPALTRRLRPGASISVSLGQSSRVLFAGDVTAVERRSLPTGDGRVRVRAYDRLQRLSRRQPVRAFVGVSLDEIVRELTADLDVTANVPASLPVWPRLIQYRHTDLEFLNHVAARCGLFFTSDGHDFTLVSLEGAGSATLLTLGGNLLEVEIEENHARSRQAVAAFGWDPSRLVWHDAGADQPRTVRAPLGVEMVGTRDGAQVLTNELATDAAHLAALAQATLDLRAGSELVATGVAEGDATLRPGCRVAITGLSGQNDRTFVVTGARHTIDRERGYTTHFSTEQPPRPTHSSHFVVAPAIVRSIDDPEKLGRVRASLPTISNLETDWLPVIAVGAGASKGVMALPDIDDEVLLLVHEDNPATGFVLGSVYGSHGWPDTGIDDGAVRRYTVLTRGGQRLDLDDTHKRIRIGNADGSYVEMSPQRTVIHSSRELVIEAPGRGIQIQAKTIDFKQKLEP